MPNHSPVAIANEFLRRRAAQAWPPQMQIQKLTYIAHGWNLAINGEPLVSAPPEAWDNGPVFRQIWDFVRDFGYRGPNCTLADPVTNHVVAEPLTPGETAVIDHVWAKYKDKSAVELSRLTHEPNTPWSKAYFGRGRNAALSNEDIRSHYVQLALAGRAAG